MARALRNSEDESEDVGILEVFEDTILAAGKSEVASSYRNCLAGNSLEQRDWKWGEHSWREKSRFWAERARKAPGSHIAWRRPVSTS